MRPSRIRFLAAAMVVVGLTGCASLEGHNSGSDSGGGSYQLSPGGGIRNNVLSTRRTGHDLGPLSPHASDGNTGIFLNGREINLTEAGFFQRVFGVVYLGHFWLDGSTGNLGIEGDPTPRTNLIAAMQRAQGSGSSEYHWRDGSGAVVGGEGNCTFAAIPGAPVYSTPGCG